MNHYSIFGGVLRSEFALPELAVVAPGRSSWRLRVSTTAPTASAREWLGEVEVEEAVGARLYRIPGGFRLEYDDTGTFDVLAGGTEIVWYAAVGASVESAQVDILGRVFALALHASGEYCLHASAVSVGGGAIGFLAPKFHGKSTTAAALVRAGARLITDDTLALAPGHPPRARPGIQTLRLWEDAAAAARVDPASARESQGKYLVGSLPDHQVVHAAEPLTALYLLTPSESNDGGGVVERTLLPPARAALALIGHSKLGSLLGGSESPVLLERAAAIAAAVPVHGLRVARDLDRLPEVAARILAWHGDPVRSRAVEGRAS